MSYGDRLGQALELSGKERKGLAQALDITVQSVGQIIRGESKSNTAENCVRAARFLRVDPYWLATGEGEPHPKAIELKDEREALSVEAVRHALEFDKLTDGQKGTWQALLEVVTAGNHQHTPVFGSSTIEPNAREKPESDTALGRGLTVRVGEKNEASEPSRVSKQGSNTGA